jgi:hypothetical protein
MPAIDIEHRTDSTGVRRISVCREDAEREGSARTRTDSTPIRTPPAAWAHCSSSDLAAEGQSSEVGALLATFQPGLRSRSMRRCGMIPIASIPQKKRRA